MLAPEKWVDGFSSYEHQYMNALKEIYENGHSDGTNERTGHETKRLPGIVIQVDLADGLPVLKSKLVYTKSAIHEMLWIMQQMSNNIKDLKPKIWDSWADKYGTIGSAYGYQVDRPVIIEVNGERRFYKDQVTFVLEYLKEFPQGRWAIITLWNPIELYKMKLCPCCHTSTWNLDGGRLNCVLDQRSGDMPVGVPFNTTQYAALTMMFAEHLGVEPGILTHVIADAHIYDNQMDLVGKQLKDFESLKKGIDLEGKDGKTISASDIQASRPELSFKEKNLNFKDQTIENMEILDYVSNKSIPYPVVE